VTRDQIVQWLRTAGNILKEKRDYLTQLDAVIGDADHGINMDRGFKKVLAQLPDIADKDIGSILKATGMALISSVGGASGPLYGTFFLQAGMSAIGKYELDTAGLTALFNAGLKGLIERGKAQAGDKTMVDALAPGAEALHLAVREGQDITEVLRLVVEATEQGMKDTIPMVARKGRASYLGKRSIGHQDPGATSSYLILKSLYDAVS